MAAALAHNDDRDGWPVHFADTMRGGQYINNWRMAEIHAKEAPDRVRELEAWGAVFDRTPDGRINQRNFGGHRYPRLAHVGDRTGLELIRTLAGSHGLSRCDRAHGAHRHQPAAAGWRPDIRRGRLRSRARTFPRLQCESRHSGDRWRRVEPTRSPATVGKGRATVMPSRFRAGAELIDMEFIQFHPTGMVWPPSVKGILVTEGVRGEGGVLKNNEGRRFMFDDIPDNYKPQTASDAEEGWRYTQGDKSARRPPELLTRDHVARCIVREVKEGRGSPHGGVFLDIAWITAKLSTARSTSSASSRACTTSSRSWPISTSRRTPMEMGPTTHYIMGGVRVDADSQMSSIAGLFAAGECASGINGANRLGGNSLSDLIVFGKRAGEYAADFARKNGAGEDGRRADSSRHSGVAVAVRSRRVRREPLQAARGPPGNDASQGRHRSPGKRNARGVRVHTGVQAARLRGSASPATANTTARWHTAIDVQNLLAVSEAITISAIERKESRGGHFREDYPDKAAAFSNVNIMIKRNPDGR